MSDRPAFSSVEVVLSGLAIGASISSFIYTGKLLSEGAFLDAMEYGGFGLMLLAAVFDPLNILADTVSFPFQVFEPSGHETKFTAVASLVGFAVMLTGWLLNLYVARGGAQPSL